MRRRRRPPRRTSPGRQILASICVGLVLGILAIHAFNSRVRPDIITIVSDHLSNQISSQICDVVNAELEDEGFTYDSICHIEYGADGNISSLQTDMARLSLLQNTITTGVAQEFDNSLIAEQVHVPIGSLLPGLIFNGRGPDITVQVQTVGNISAEFDNEFFSEGINQTLHRVVLRVTADLSLLLPGGIYTYTSETRMILAETVLLGQVPDSFGVFGGLESAKWADDATYYDLTTDKE